MAQSLRRYIREKEELEYRQGYTNKQMEASQLRKAFIKKFIIDFDVNFYQTQQERDWAYIAKREYRWNCNYHSAADGFFAANVVSLARIYQTKKMSFLPYLFVWPIVSLYLHPLKLQKHNKKLFDMCNLGDEFYLGQERNKVLRECNRILDQEDF